MNHWGERREHWHGIGHAPVCEWDQRWKGKTWRDMPGHDEEIKKMNFFLYRRGLHDGGSSAQKRWAADRVVSAR